MTTKLNLFINKTQLNFTKTTLLLPLLLLLIYSCSTSKLIVDSTEDQFVSKPITEKEIENFELDIAITIEDSYRRAGNAWAGAFICAENENAVHSKDKGYLFYIRENGEVGLVSSNLDGEKFAERKYIKSVDESNSIRARIMKQDQYLAIYINEVRSFVLDDLKVNGNFITANTGGSRAHFLIHKLSETKKNSKNDLSTVKIVDCSDREENFTGMCKTYYRNGVLSDIRKYNSGKIVELKRYNKDGLEFHSLNLSNIQDFSFSEEMYFSLGKKKMSINILNGTGTAELFRSNGKKSVIGNVKDKKLVFPWVVYDHEEKVVDTLENLEYSKSFDDPEKLKSMIIKTLVAAEKQRDEINRFGKGDIIVEVAPPAIELNAEEIEKKYPNGVPIVDYPDKDAEFPGGARAMKSWISENLKYPKTATETHTEGKVYVEFIVLKDGSIEDIKILRGVSEAIDKEAIRLVETMPKWKPGQQRGKDINTRNRIPIVFKLKK